MWVPRARLVRPAGRGDGGVGRIERAARARPARAARPAGPRASRVAARAQRRARARPRGRGEGGRAQELRGRAGACGAAVRHGARGRRLHAAGLQGARRHAGPHARAAHDEAGLARAARAHARLLPAAVHVRDAAAHAALRGRGGGGGGRGGQPLQKNEDDLRRCAGGPRPEGRGARGLRVETRTCAIECGPGLSGR